MSVINFSIEEGKLPLWLGIRGEFSMSLTYFVLHQLEQSTTGKRIAIAFNILLLSLSLRFQRSHGSEVIYNPSRTLKSILEECSGSSTQPRVATGPIRESPGLAISRGLHCRSDSNCVMFQKWFTKQAER